MMTSKPQLHTSTQEECGVWLDPVQLKGKAKQKRVARPISKLLNPFAKCGGYSLSVALNFTQTKMEMPKAKQSCISTFFVPQRRILKKMSSEAPRTNTVQSTSPSTSTETTHLGFATKRRREIDCEMSDCHNSEEHQDNILHELKNEAEAAARREQDKARYSSFENLYCEREEEQFQEINPPERKRRLIDPSSLPDDSQPVPLAWSQDPLITYSQDSNVESNPTNQKYTTAKDLNDCETSSLNSVQSEEAFVFRMDMEGRTSTQKPFELSQRDDEKENGRSWSSFSPSKHPHFSQPRTLSNRMWTEPEPASPLKHIQEHLWEKADTEDITHSQAKWAKPRSSPLKKRATQRQVIEVDEDSLAMLFTQDTEGFRVIAHRSRQVRSPLKDQSNLHTGTTGRSSAHKCLVEEDEDEEILLTQDSQGYMVIKH